MKNGSRLLTSILALFLFQFMNPATVQAQCPFLYWHSHSFIKQLTKQWRFQVRLDYRFQNDPEKLDLHFSDYEVRIFLGTHVSFSANYRQVYQRSSKFRPEHRPHLNLTWKSESRHVLFQNRMRAERRFRHGAEAVWRFRNKTGLGLIRPCPVLMGRPFLEEEIFWDGNTGKRIKHWHILGSRIQLSPKLNLKLFGMLQMVKQGNKWKNDWIVGTDFICSI